MTTQAESDTGTSSLDEGYSDWLDEDHPTAFPATSDEVPDLDDKASALDAYMARLGNLDPLSDERQKELARRYREEDDDAAGHLLVMTNLRLVVKLARDYTNDWDEVLELVQEGNLGMSKALDRYDPSRGVKFTSYAQYWIRARILDYLINRGRTIRLGSSRAGRKLFYNLNDARESLRDDGVEPTPERLAEVLDVDVEDVVRVGNQMDQAPVSLDKSVADEATDTIGDLMEADTEDPEERAATRECRHTIRDAVETFGDQLEEPRRRAVWNKRIVADEPKLLRELGGDWDVSKERIRQIESSLHVDFRTFFRRRVGGRSELKQFLK